MLDSIDVFWALLSKVGFSVGWRAFYAFLLKMGCPGSLALVLSFAWRALNGTLFQEQICWMDNHRGWTSIFESSSGGNSIGSSEGSVNQPVPDSPEPVAPAAPLALEAYEPLQEDEDRRHELRDRLRINSFGHSEIRESIVEKQLQIERKIEQALLSDGYSRESLLAKRHQIRGFLLYPQGTTLSESTYVKHLRIMRDHGTHRSVPYQRILQAISDYDLSLEKKSLKKDGMELG